MVTIADLEKMDVETNISEDDALADRAGPAGRGLRQRDSVQAVPGPAPAGAADERPDAQRVVKVKVEILDPDDKLFPELAATVHFLPSESVNSPDAGRSYLFVPKSAVFQENGHDFVWVIRDRQYSAQESGRGGIDDRRLGAGRVGT